MKKTPAKPAAERRKTQPKRRVEDVLPDFRDMIDNAVQGIMIHRNFKPLYANDAFAKLFGYAKAADILKMPLLRALVPGDMWARLESEYGALMRGEKEFVITRARALHKDGHEIWIAVTERVIDWHGQPAVQVNAFDVSDQMLLEQTLLRNEQRLRAMLEILPYPIYIARREDGQMLFVNRKTCLLFQQSAKQLRQSRSVDFFDDPKEREELRLLLETVSDIRDVEVRMKTAHGRIFTAELAAITMDYDGTPAVLVALNDISQRKELENELYRQASTDMLTGINNRRSFMAAAEQELRRTRRFARMMSVMMLDLDHFKPINDQYGHAVGDIVLQGVVKRVLESLRSSDLLGRLGGEEFAVLLPETAIAAAADVAERTRKHLAERPLIINNGQTGHIAIPCTVSVGIAQLSAQDGNVDELLHRADQALYRAKHGGRNRVETAD